MNNSGRRHLIRGKRLCKLLNVSLATLQKWKTANLLDGTLVGNESHYYVDSVVALLARASYLSGTPVITFDDLVTKKVTLLKVADVKRMTGWTYSAIRARMDTGQLHAIKFGTVREWYFVASSVEAALTTQEESHLIDRNKARHILGISLDGVQQLVAGGRLKTETVQRGRFLHHPVTQESMLALLSELLPSWVSAEDWLQDRLETEEPLLDMRTLATKLSMSRAHVRALLDEEKWQYIRSPGAKKPTWFVSAESLRAHFERDKELSTADLANILCCAKRTAEMWRQAGQLDCHIHDDHEKALYRSCVLVLLKVWLSPKILPQSWYDMRMYGNSRMFTIAEAAEYLGVKPRYVVKMYAQGKLQGLEVSKNHKVCSYRQIRKVRLKLTRQ